MNLRVLMAVLVISALETFAQPNAALDTPFQVRSAANVDLFNTPGEVDSVSPGMPDSVAVKLRATTNAGSCNAAAPGPMTAGLAAYMTTAHAGGPSYNAPCVRTETTFTPASPGVAEIARISGVCRFIQANLSGYGVCGVVPE